MNKKSFLDLVFSPFYEEKVMNVTLLPAFLLYGNQACAQSYGCHSLCSSGNSHPLGLSPCHGNGTSQIGPQYDKKGFQEAKHDSGLQSPSLWPSPWLARKVCSRPEGTVRGARDSQWTQGWPAKASRRKRDQHRTSGWQGAAALTSRTVETPATENKRPDTGRK